MVAMRVTALSNKYNKNNWLVGVIKKKLLFYRTLVTIMSLFFDTTAKKREITDF